jgi:hypothetical protein
MLARARPLLTALGPVFTPANDAPDGDGLGAQEEMG